MDIYLVLFFSTIINIYFPIASRANTFDILDELIDGDRNDLPPWEIQRKVFQQHLCNDGANDTLSNCNLVELVIQNMEENLTNVYEIVRRILKKANLYGGRPSETIDPITVDDVIHNCMYIEIFGTKVDFLIFILDVIEVRSNKLIKDYNDEIRRKLTERKMNDSNGLLSNNAALWLMDNLIHPLLPNLKKIPDVSSYDYAFAQAGMAFARSLKWNLTSLSEQELIYLSHLVEESSKQDKANMKIFMLPVLIKYYHTHKDAKETLKIDLRQGIFDWTTAFYEFFDQMQKTMNNPAIKYFSAISSYRNRTRMAKDIIEEQCTKIGYYGDVTSYKNSRDKYHCIDRQYMLQNEFWLYLLNLLQIRPRSPGKTLRIPDVTQLFQEQNRRIADRFKEYEQHLIILALKDDARVKNDIANQTVHNSEIYTSLTVPSINVRTAPGPIIYQKLMSDKVDIFGFSDMNSTNPADCSKYYAVIRDESRMAFSAYNKNYPTYFYMDVVDSDVNNNVFKDIKIHCIASSILKKSEENETQLATSIASYRANQLFKYLTESGMEETVLEEFTKFVSYLIPFYEGIQKIMADEITEGQFLLLLDTLAFIPLAGSSIKITYKLFKQFAVPALRLILAKESIFMAFRMGLSAMAAEAQTLLFSRAAFTGIGKEILRAVDPGFELAFSIGKGAASFVRTLKYKFPIFLRFSNLIDTTEQILKSSRIKNVFLPRIKGSSYISKIAKYAGKNVYVKVRPVIQNSKSIMMYGHRYLELPNDKYGELWSLAHRPFQIPVELRTHFRFEGRPVFWELDTSTGEINGLRLIANKNGKLNYKLIPSSCLRPTSRLKRHNPTIADATASPAELIIANALSCSVHEARVLLTQYFIETRYTLNMVVAAIRDERRIPDFMRNLRLRFPELLYGFEMFSPITTPYMIRNAQQSIKNIYNAEELKLIDIDIDSSVPSIIGAYNKCLKRGEFISFEEYFALRNFGRTGSLRIKQNTNEAIQMRNALRRRTIMQSFRLQRRKSFTAYSFNTYTLANFKKRIVKNKILPNPVDFVPMNTDSYYVLKQFPSIAEGLVPIVFKAEITSDGVVADISNIYRNLIVIHKKNFRLKIEAITDVDFLEYPHLGTVKFVTLTHTEIDRTQHITQLMNDIE